MNAAAVLLRVLTWRAQGSISVFGRPRSLVIMMACSVWQWMGCGGLGEVTMAAASTVRRSSLGIWTEQQPGPGGNRGPSTCLLLA